MNIPAIIAPTACGKNNFALNFCKTKSKLALVNVDSAQIYQELTIGANLPTIDERRECPHYLYAIQSVLEPSDVSIFLKQLEQTLDGIKKKNEQACLLGGTMMYFYQMISGLVQIPQIPRENLERWREQHHQVSNQVLHEKLMTIDKPMAQKISMADTQRLQRAVSVFDLTGQTLSYWQKKPAREPSFKIQPIKLTYADKERHRQVIYDRMLLMFERGLLEEVRLLLEKFPDRQLPFWNYVGYRQVRQGLEEKWSLLEIQQRVFFATCQLAKRQKTWLKKFDGPTIFVDEQNAYEQFEQAMDAIKSPQGPEE